MTNVEKEDRDFTEEDLVDAFEWSADVAKDAAIVEVMDPDTSQVVFALARLSIIDDPDQDNRSGIIFMSTSKKVVQNVWMLMAFANASSALVEGLDDRRSLYETEEEIPPFTSWGIVSRGDA